MGESELLEVVQGFIITRGLLGKRRRVLVACSGGADSTALLDILRRLAPRLRLSLGVVTVDHGLRADFTRVADTLRRRCRRWKIPFWLERLAPGPDSETALRVRRYRLLEEFARQQRFDRVATGHTSDDQVETVLMRLLRGTGVTGLAGIPVQRQQLFIRPLLPCRHRDLCRYLRTRRLSWWSDPANRSERHLRNRVRRQLLPLLARQYNPAVGEALLRLSEVAEFHRQLLDELAAGFEIREGRGAAYVDRRRFAAAPAALQLHLLQHLAARVRPATGGGLLQRQLLFAREKLARPDVRADITLDLGGGLRCGIASGRVFVSAVPGRDSQAFAFTVDGPGVVTCEPAGWRLRFRRNTRRQRLSEEPARVVFDAGECSFPLLVRSWRPGDRLSPWPGGGRRKVADILAEAKIPRQERWRIPLLLCGERVLWVAGVCRASAAPVSATTTNTIEVSLEWFDSGTPAVLASPCNPINFSGLAPGSDENAYRVDG